jgi:hypothetical protein
VPVAPVTSTIPRGWSAILRSTGGRPSVSNVGGLSEIVRITSESAPRCRNTFTRNRPTPG